MNFNHDQAEESYVNGSVDGFKDFTDCLDFTKQYQKSCFGEEFKEEEKKEEVRNGGLENGGTFMSMEPDVSITVEESNLEKTINHVAKGEEEKKVNGEESLIVKKKRVINKKRNHIKPPVNRNLKKKNVLKFKNGRYMQRKNNHLLSNVKFRCYKCSNSEFSSLSELVNHQRKCLSGPQENPLIPESCPKQETKTPRKVYLCSACGNYYENWNLFIHMIEMHKRHICLYCLGMFSNPEKLSQHLQVKHNVIEQNLSTTEDFLNLYRGTCYLICCTCEKVFSDEKFDQHSCEGGKTEETAVGAGPCPLCGLSGAHFPTCRRAFSDRFVNPGGYKSHPALGKKKLTNKKKKKKEVFKIVSNDNNEMSVTVRKQPEEKSEPDAEEKETTDYNEKMLQLYKKPTVVEKVTSTLQSIEDSINRVVESSVIKEEEPQEEEEEEEEADTNLPEPEIKDESKTEDVSVNIKEQITNKEHLNMSDNDSNDSMKLTIADEPDIPDTGHNCDNNESYIETNESNSDAIPTAGADIPYIYVTITDPDKPVKALIKDFVKESCWNCVYCAHVKRIAVNGKQLALHLIAEHRFASVPADAPDEDKNESVKTIVSKLTESLDSLNEVYFNTDTFDSEDKSFWKANDRIYECFHCLFATYVHKELYTHNKKMHQKTVFLCIMCKSNFYNYSELLCHLCPGIYVPGVVINPDINFRCFLCDADPLPSSFRLMVHLRRRHNSCDICFEASTNQSQLSTHVWKHKLSHYCYRCGIAYRNKPDITKHLFWKHGTESVLCKRCLQKKWPHVYHFCVPPVNFTCDECPSLLKSAVALKVHKRIHMNDHPHACTECEEKFISKKLLAKHAAKHEEEKNPPPPPPEPEPEPELEPEPEPEPPPEPEPVKEKKKKKKPLTEILDLPPVNLSESDDSDEEEPVPVPKEPEPAHPPPPSTPPLQNGYLEEESPENPPEIVDGIWNNFQNYLVSKDPTRSRIGSPFKNMTMDRIKEIMLSDHDYHIIPNNPNNVSGGDSEKTDAEKAEEKEKIGLDHDYCNNIKKKKDKGRKRREGSKSSSSDSSSDSDSSCSCGSNCSCTSGSSSSSSSETESGDEGGEPDERVDEKERRKEKKKRVSKEIKVDTEAEAEPQMEIDVSVNDIEPPIENPIRDSDLETSETETDEDFYDYNPAKIANRILAEKRLQLLANLNGSDVPVSSPSTPTTELTKTPVQKKKTKMKKRRSGPAPRKRPSVTGPKQPRKKPPPAAVAAPPPQIIHHQPVIPPVYHYNGNGMIGGYDQHLPGQRENSADSDARRPKRKRVPLKFYGFSSDEEEAEKGHKKRERVEHNTTTPAPLATSTPTPLREEIPTIWNPHSKNSLSWRVEKSEPAAPSPTTPQPKVNPIKIRTSQTMRNNFYTSGTSEFSIKIKQPERPERLIQINGNSGMPQPPAPSGRGEKLYCFCQCPYDEVSEMIACDAKDCLIEWFHFECVGIMVPPQGSWYCPDCRKKLAAENEFMPVPAENV